MIPLNTLTFRRYIYLERDPNYTLGYKEPKYHDEYYETLMGNITTENRSRIKFLFINWHITASKIPNLNIYYFKRKEK
jgi:hypothetical protein